MEGTISTVVIRSPVSEEGSPTIFEIRRDWAGKNPTPHFLCCDRHAKRSPKFTFRSCNCWIQCCRINLKIRVRRKVRLLDKHILRKGKMLSAGQFALQNQGIEPRLRQRMDTLQSNVTIVLGEKVQGTLSQRSTHRNPWWCIDFYDSCSPLDHLQRIHINLCH